MKSIFRFKADAKRYAESLFNKTQGKLVLLIELSRPRFIMHEKRIYRVSQITVNAQYLRYRER